MSQIPGEKPGQAAVARSEELWNSLGQRLGLFTDLVSQRMQNAASSIREEADQIDQPQTIPAGKSSAPTAAQAEASGQPVTHKAEQMVDQMGQRVNHFTATTSLEVQKATARLREEAEDMWAEAQNIRHKNGPK
ncbi:MAG: hypothetical protein NVSMB27_08390 [Ktedonobacteraceae bacterium]